jgi:hypothetical protein
MVDLVGFMMMGEGEDYLVRICAFWGEEVEKRGVERGEGMSWI